MKFGWINISQARNFSLHYSYSNTNTLISSSLKSRFVKTNTDKQKKAKQTEWSFDIIHKEQKKQRKKQLNSHLLKF